MRLLLATGNAQGKNLRLVADKEGNIPLLCAIEIGNVPVARELLLSSTQDQMKTGKGSVGDCAIHLAARKGDNDLVKLFIESGTKVDTQNVSSDVMLWNVSVMLLLLYLGGGSDVFTHRLQQR